MYNKRRRAQPEYKKCIRQSAKRKKILPTFELTYNLRSKTNDVVPLSRLSEESNKHEKRSLCCTFDHPLPACFKEETQTILRRSKRIHQKNSVSLKRYDCVSDYYMQMQNEGSLFKKINKKYDPTIMNDMFCEVLEKQLSHIHTSHLKTKTLQTIKSLVMNMNAVLEGNDKTDLVPTPEKLNFFRTENKPLFFEDEPNIFDAECTSLGLSPHISFGFSNKLLDEQSFTFDEDVFFPTMPTLKNPSPLKFYPRMMHKL